jgi:hypothetical protein
MRELCSQFNHYYHVARKYDVITSANGDTGTCVVGLALGIYCNNRDFPTYDAIWFVHFE